MNNKQILIISPETWKWQHVSKHHYAIVLANLGYKVYYLNPPVSILNELKIFDTEYKNLYEMESPQITKGLRFYPKKIRNFIEKRWLTKLEMIIGAKFTTIWLFENSRFYDMDFSGDRLKIYHQVDSNQNFHIPEAASSADICFCVTDAIKKDLLQYNQKVLKIPHGINLSIQKSCLSQIQEQKISNTINVAYIGNLDMIYINENILYDVVQSFPYISFHFIGSFSENGALYKRCKNAKNAIWWGRVDSKLIPSILEKMDINLLAYRVEEYAEQLANSHKILEYIYSGKVTIATYTDEYKDKRHLLEMVDDSKDFFTTFEKVINDLPFYNSPEKQAERIAFAKNNTYAKQLDTIINYLKQHNLHL